MSAQRYSRSYGDMDENNAGDWVKSDDYAALEAEIKLLSDKACAAVTRYRDALGSLTDSFKYPTEVCQIARAAMAASSLETPPADTIDTSAKPVEKSAKDRQILEWIWQNCRVVFYPADGAYPIEHAPKARKDMRRAIEHVAGAALETDSKA